VNGYTNRDPLLEASRLSDPDYFAAMQTKYRAQPLTWLWYVNYHVHGCKRCNRVWAHTGLEATRDGDASHMCCGHNVSMG
jgi:hypothetical protein